MPAINDTSLTASLALRNEEVTYTISEPSPVKSLAGKIEGFLARNLALRGKTLQQNNLVVGLHKLLRLQMPDTPEYLNAVTARREDLYSSIAKQLVLRALQCWDSLIIALPLNCHTVSLQTGKPLDELKVMASRCN